MTKLLNRCKQFIISLAFGVQLFKLYKRNKVK